MTTDSTPSASSTRRASTDAPLHIVFVSMHTSPTASPGAADAGGMNVVELSSALALGKLGHRVDLITRWDHPDLPEVQELAPGVRLFPLRVGPAESVAKSAQEEFIEPFSQALDGWFEGYGADVDVIHSQHWFSGVAALPVARRRGIAHIQSFHSVAAPVGAELGAGEQPESEGRIAGERLVARESDRVIAVSEAEKATVIERYGCDPATIDVVHPGVDLELFRPLAPGEVAFPELGHYVLFAARLQPLKGADLAVEAVAKLDSEALGYRPNLVIAGEASADFADYRDELKALVADQHLADRVSYLGSQSRSDLAALIRGAAVLINPSHSETFGLINLEASASGVPVVATRAGGMSESVIDSVTGILVDSRDADDWADALASVLEPDRRAALARGGRQFAQRRGWDVVANDLIESYRGLNR